MEIQTWSIDRPKDYPLNARKWSPKAIAKVAASLKEYGWRQPIVVDESDVIVIGHLRRTAARSIGIAECPVHIARDLSPEQIRGLRLADNRTNEEATWDNGLLAAEFQQLRAMDFNLSATGFDLREMERLLPPPDVSADETPAAPDVAISKAGDLWVLGEHRLLCGDSTDTAAVGRLMNGQRAQLLATDPPYLVNYTGGRHPQSWTNEPEVANKSWDDYVDPAAAIEFYESFLRIGLEHLLKGGAVYQWHAALMQYLVHQAWLRCGLLVHQHIVWVKARAVLTHSHYMWQHEVAFYGWPKGNQPERRPPANCPTVWTIDQKGESDGIHPTQKPVELARRPIEYHTEQGAICYEPFGGSGTTLIAAEAMHRRCYAMEISPVFCDVIVKRWETFTGKKATLEAPQ